MFKLKSIESYKNGIYFMSVTYYYVIHVIMVIQLKAFMPKAEIPSQRPRLLPRSITKLNSP